MHLPADPPPLTRLAIFGDSHYACVRRAHTEGLAATTGFDIEYWGHVGSRFRMLGYENGAIVPTDAATANRFAKFNDKGRRFLPVADFDAVLFVGCRFQTMGLLMTLAQARADGRFLSDGLKRRMIRDRLSSNESAGFARNFARDGQAKILFSPTSLPLVGWQDAYIAAFPAAPSVEAEERAEINAMFAEAFANHGVDYLPQPDHTITDGCFTSLVYASEDFAKTEDHEHKSATYGALVLEAALQKLGATPRLLERDRPA